MVGPELTVPIEERIAFWNEKKTGKYEKMNADHGSPSWKLNALLQKLVAEDTFHLLSEKRSNTLDSPQRN